jgi:hypothetical protein
MSGEKQEYCVKDRRHFSSDGSPRDAADGVADSEKPRAAEESAPAPAREPPVTFAAFVLSLAGQAHLLLKTEGQDAPTAEELGHVRHIVAILEMLQEKTQGRLDAGEQRLLEHLLFELRLGYVHKTGGAGA